MHKTWQTILCQLLHFQWSCCYTWTTLPPLKQRVAQHSSKLCQFRPKAKSELNQQLVCRSTLQVHCPATTSHRCPECEVNLKMHTAVNWTAYLENTSGFKSDLNKRHWRNWANLLIPISTGSRAKGYCSAFWTVIFSLPKLQSDLLKDFWYLLNRNGRQVDTSLCFFQNCIILPYIFSKNKQSYWGRASSQC